MHLNVHGKQRHDDMNLKTQEFCFMLNFLRIEAGRAMIGCAVWPSPSHWPPRIQTPDKFRITQSSHLRDPHVAYHFPRKKNAKAVCWLASIQGFFLCLIRLSFFIHGYCCKCAAKNCPTPLIRPCERLPKTFLFCTLLKEANQGYNPIGNCHLTESISVSP
jgi:hypothetical protein